jgi:tetratricopeptide (TPR) repeat protein
LRRHLALALYLAGRVEEARTELEAVRGKQPQTPGDDFLYGSVLSALGENEAALRVLQPLAKQRPIELERVEALADVLMRLGESEKAATALESAVAPLQQQGDDKAALQARVGQLHALVQAKAWSRVVRIARQALQAAEPSEKAPLIGFLIDGLHGEGRDQAALRLLDDPPVPLPAPLVTIKRLRILHDSGSMSEVERRLEELTAAGSAADLALAGRMRLEWGQQEEAIKLLQRALQQDGATPPMRYWLASAYQDAGREGEAEALLRQLLQEEPDFVPALNFLGYMLADDGRDLQEALKLTRRAVRADPANGAYVDSLGWAHFRLGELDLAKQYLERAARLIPNDATIFEHLGDLYSARGEHDAARRVYRRALELQPENPAGVERKLAHLGPGS